MRCFNISKHKMFQKYEMLKNIKNVKIEVFQHFNILKNMKTEKHKKCKNWGVSTFQHSQNIKC